MDVVALSRGLTAEHVLAAYPRGRFPMAYVEENLVTWHQPKVRAIIPLDALRVSARLDRTIRQGRFHITFDQAFRDVMRGCASGRPMWISDEFLEVFGELFDRGFAHSVEVWTRGEAELAGGLYGLAIGGAFFAESKFHRVRDASKVAVVTLARRLAESGFDLLEVQYLTEHLAQFGTIEVSHREYMRRLEAALAVDARFPTEPIPFGHTGPSVIRSATRLRGPS